MDTNVQSQQTNSGPAAPEVVTPVRPPLASPSEPAKESYNDYKARRMNPDKPEGETQGGDQPRKARNPIEPRISELTKARDEHKSAAEREKERADKAERELAEYRAAKPAEVKAEPVKAEPAKAEPSKDAAEEPDLEKYLAEAKDGETYVQVQKRWSKDVREWDRKQAATANEAATKQTQAQATAKQRMENAEKRRPGLQAKVDAIVKALPNTKNDGLGAALEGMDQDGFADVIDHLAGNHEEYKRICALTPQQAYREVLRLEMKLGGAEQPAKQAPIASKAPAPAAVLSGGAGAPEKEVSKMSYSEYQEHAKKRIAQNGGARRN